jgi:hypothetical protein
MSYSDSWWGSTVATTLTGSDTIDIWSALLFLHKKDVRPRFISVHDIPNNLAMNGARDTVLQLEVHLGNSVFWEYGSVRDITWNQS